MDEQFSHLLVVVRTSISRKPTIQKVNSFIRAPGIDDTIRSSRKHYLPLVVANLEILEHNSCSFSPIQGVREVGPESKGDHSIGIIDEGYIPLPPRPSILAVDSL